LVEIARVRARAHNVEINAFVSDWQGLSGLPGRYDLVFCYGNSISHSLSKEERRKNLGALRKCLVDDGALVLETRNWDRMGEARYTVYGDREYKGKRYVPIYVWEKVELGRVCRVHMIFVESGGGKLVTYERKLSFMPFSREELLGDSISAGFEVIGDSYSEVADNYSLFLKKV
jgi:glycine/sarcosine N-methyltransferase